MSDPEGETGRIPSDERKAAVDSEGHRGKFHLGRGRMMRISYRDIESRIAEPPAWFHDGVPRYLPFGPRELSVYNCVSVLARVACQVCNRPFLVGIVPKSQDVQELANDPGVLNNLSDDPPFHDHEAGQCDGLAMTWILRELVEVWARGPQGGDFVRRHEFERTLPPDFFDH
ncbi:MULTISPECIES: hypothetical protein [unclassified Bradyrhizobium]|uniref:hypothetical protein n=1 Tax=unclassified Bradyrhizobium TaxID=2631580 RepID=UPI0028EFCA85|nr:MULTISPECIES: hypothetical protein [unclassified Bradyrhizobium]